jgi:vacuolar-type H+-ATPase subunit E/Vma4
MASELIDLLEREAEAERERVLSEARERAARVVQEAEAEAKAKLEQHRRQVAVEVEAARVRAQGLANLQATSLLLETKDQLVAEVFRRAEEELDRIADDPARYAPVLRELLREAASGFHSHVVVECPERDVAAVEAAARELGLSADVRPSPDVRGGVRVRSEDGRFTVENTLRSRLERARQVLLSEVAGVLWGD